MKRQLALTAATVAVALTGVAGTASASAPTTPTGHAGAWNMLNDPTMLPGSGGPMDRDNPNGNAGMCRAVLASSGVGC
jgi:hypothetical protein